MKTALLWAAVLSLGAAGCDSCSRGGGGGASADAGVVTLIPDAAPLNVVPIPAASVAKAVNPQSLPAYSGPTGSVEGTIFVTGDPAPVTPANFAMCPAGGQTYGHLFREGEAKSPGGPRWLADAVVAVTGYSNFFVPETKEAKSITIENCAFSTRTITMTFGQRLEVKNLTNEFWAPQIMPTEAPMLMMAAPNGDPVKLYPKHAGHYLLVDHDRQWAKNDLFVFLHPLHTSSAVGGTYRIDGVPTGKVKVNTSHPRFEGEASQDVEIRPNVVARVDLTLKFTTPPPALPEPDAGPRPKLH